jgi:23S rRNA (uracil1939-C5)-methyltransferase
MSLRCPHRPPCPGCPRFGEPLAGSPALAVLSRFAEQAGIALEIVASAEPRGYRQRARLAVRGRASSPKLGIFQEGSHRIVDIPACLVHHPLINDTAAALKQALRELRIEPYADVPHRGLLRYVQIAVERTSGTAQVVLVANTEERALLEPLFARVQTLLGSRLHSGFFSANTGRGNVILGPRCDKLSGPDALHERIAGADVFFPPDAFEQGNLELYERIVERIGTLVPDGSEVLELYAGTGAIGLSLLPRSARVRFVEHAPGSLRGLRMGVDALGPALRDRAEVLAGSAAEHAGLAAGAELVVVDPPRKGLDPALLAGLCAEPPARLLYLSCGLPSLLADARALLHDGRQGLCELIAYELLPFTGHAEILARFERGG